MKKEIIVVSILFIGVIFRLFITSGGNFIFNMDTARDMIDIREMVILKKLRLTGPGTSISGVYDGPAWYYLLAIPFLVTSGDPYGSIILQIILWIIGGFYLLKLTSRFGLLVMLSVGSLWVASDFIVLASVYVFNPNPVIFLTPLLIYTIEKYIISGRLIYSLLIWSLAGLFYNFEMNFGIFIPLIIFCSICFSRKATILKSRNFWIGISIFVITLLPQIIFDLKHELIMSKSLVAHLHRESDRISLFNRFQDIIKSFYGVFIPTILNVRNLSIVLLVFSIPVLLSFFRSRKRDPVVTISMLYIFIPFVTYIFLPVSVNPWHLGGEMIASIIVIGFLLRELRGFHIGGKLVSFCLSLLIIIFATKNILNFFIYDMGKPNSDPAVYKNEIAVIDYVYKYAGGKNFKVYTYLPSIYDYPYQYLIWWYGLKEFGYLPIDYSYSPNKFAYISNKEKFSATIDDLKKRQNSNLVFLIKEPDRNYTRAGWEGDFFKLESIGKQMIGSIEVEVRKE